jgi:hypothetical protein
MAKEEAEKSNELSYEVFSYYRNLMKGKRKR